MGNCLACFKDKTGRRSSYDGAGSCKYQPPGRGAATEAATTTVTTKEQQDVASANLNNNYPPTYSQQQQHRHNLTNRDVLEQSGESSSLCVLSEIVIQGPLVDDGSLKTKYASHNL